MDELGVAHEVPRVLRGGREREGRGGRLCFSFSLGLGLNYDAALLVNPRPDQLDIQVGYRGFCVGISFLPSSLSFNMLLNALRRRMRWRLAPSLPCSCASLTEGLGGVLVKLCKNTRGEATYLTLHVFPTSVK